MNRSYLLFSLLLLSFSPSKALAHGANIEYQKTSAVTIRATYDDGSPMEKAQVVIYAPSDRVTPWLKGTTDESGNFTFVADATTGGNWDVKIRQAGHGDIVSIPVKDGKIADNTTQTQLSSVSNSYTPMQKIVMAAAGIWGFVGTALFFSRFKSSK